MSQKYDFEQLTKSLHRISATLKDLGLFVDSLATLSETHAAEDVWITCENSNLLPELTRSVEVFIDSIKRFEDEA